MWLWLAGAALAVVLPALKLTKSYIGEVRRKRCKVVEGVTDYEHDLVYLHQFPRWIVKQVPNLSPFAMKLETWLRFKKIKYKVVDTLTWSNRGQSPFIYFNGQQIADSNRIIEHLTKYFGLDESEGLDKREQGASRALRLMVEANFSWTYFYYRYVEHRYLFAKVYRLPVLATFIRWLMAKGVAHRCYQVGIARNSPEEMYAIGGDDIRAISKYLGDRQYLCGSEPTAVDCCVFAHLSQVAYVRSMPYPQRHVLETECDNVVQYLNRMKERYWPDWDEIVDSGEFS